MNCSLFIQINDWAGLDNQQSSAYTIYSRVESKYQNVMKNRGTYYKKYVMVLNSFIALDIQNNIQCIFNTIFYSNLLPNIHSLLFEMRMIQTKLDRS